MSRNLLFLEIPVCFKHPPNLFLPVILLRGGNGGLEPIPESLGKGQMHLGQVASSSQGRHIGTNNRSHLRAI